MGRRWLIYGAVKMPKPNTPTPLVDEYKAAELLGVSVHTLRKDRQNKKRFPFVRFGLNGAIRYDINLLRGCIRANTNGGAK